MLVLTIPRKIVTIFLFPNCGHIVHICFHPVHLYFSLLNGAPPHSNLYVDLGNRRCQILNVRTYALCSSKLGTYACDAARIRSIGREEEKVTVISALSEKYGV